MTVAKQVTRWADELEGEAIEAGVDPDVYVPIGLSLIRRESYGDPYAYRPGSQFRGLLQIGRLAAMDAGYPDLGHLRTSKVFHGNGTLSIEKWIKVNERYRSRTFYDDPRVPKHLGAAILWKGGAGTARRIKDYLRNRPNATLAQAMRWIETHPNRKMRIPNLSKYVNSVDRYFAAYNHWYQTEYDRAQPSFEGGVDLVSLGGLLGRIIGAIV